MKKQLFLLSIALVTAASASAEGDCQAGPVPGPGDGAVVFNNGDKGNNNEKGGPAGSTSSSTTTTTTTTNTRSTKKATRFEDFIWTMPNNTEAVKVDEAEMESAVVGLYKWYLQNESKINNSQSTQVSQGKSMAAPFKIDPKALQQYFQFIKKNFPGLNEESLGEKQASAVQKKLAPVTAVDDVEAPMPITNK
ncbi:hypothetical protein MKQ70_30265 [Chitinophaga sedimenti]|uniref:hypothetical protein n=1 Tax=Chitinophaga sedimenti TaxID=2033606 RepID=UPI00200537CF|nr:hypothetical protein [Chitinophaga sedimenti]MCK7559032.1 hypothetical protein [Chitinophaga sedimenti]